VSVKKHIHLGLNEDGEPVAAFETIEAAREAVDDDGSLTNAEIVDYWPDVPLMDRSVDSATDQDGDRDA
jgi:hypothetical protein